MNSLSAQMLGSQNSEIRHFVTEFQLLDPEDEENIKSRREKGGNFPFLFSNQLGHCKKNYNIIHIFS